MIKNSVGSNLSTSEKAGKVKSLSEIIRWSNNEFTLKRFLESYSSHRLPVIVRTTCGFSGGDGSLHEIGTNELYWVMNILEQRRVVAKAFKGVYVSIPLSYDKLFHKISNNSQSPTTEPVNLAQSIGQTGHRIKGQRIIESSCQRIGLNLTERQPNSLGVLELQDIYTEKYLVAHSILDDEIHSTAVAIPVYLPITLQVAEGFLNSDITAFSSWTYELGILANNFDHRRVTVCEDILVFEEKPSSSDYAYQRQSRYVSSHIFDESPYSVVSQDPNSLLLQTPNSGSSMTPPPTLQHRSRLDQPLNRSASMTAPVVPHVIMKKNLYASGGSSSSSDSDSDYLKLTSLWDRDKLPARTNTATGHKPGASTLLPGKAIMPMRTNAEDVIAVCPASRHCTLPTPRDHASSRKDNSRWLVDCNKWRFPTDIPADADVAQLSVEQLARCVELLGIPSPLAQQFRNQVVDGKLLMEALNEDLLVSEFGCRRFDAKKLMMFAREKWRPKEEREMT